MASNSETNLTLPSTEMKVYTIPRLSLFEWVLCFDLPSARMSRMMLRMRTARGSIWARAFECSVPSRQNCLGRIWRCGLVGGGASLGVGFEVSKGGDLGQMDLWMRSGFPSIQLPCTSWATISTTTSSQGHNNLSAVVRMKMAPRGS